MMDDIDRKLSDGLARLENVRAAVQGQVQSSSLGHSGSRTYLDTAPSFGTAGAHNPFLTGSANKMHSMGSSSGTGSQLQGTELTALSKVPTDFTMPAGGNSSTRGGSTPGGHSRASTPKHAFSKGSIGSGIGSRPYEPVFGAGSTRGGHASPAGSRLNELISRASRGPSPADSRANALALRPPSPAYAGASSSFDDRPRSDAGMSLGGGRIPSSTSALDSMLRGQPGSAYKGTGIGAWAPPSVVERPIGSPAAQSVFSQPGQAVSSYLPTRAPEFLRSQDGRIKQMEGELRTRRLEDEVEGLTKLLQEYKSRYNEKDEKLEDIATEAKTLRKDYELVLAQKTQATDDSRALQEAVERLTRDKTELLERVDVLDREEGEQETLIERLTSELQSVQHRFIVTDEDNTTKTEEITSLKKTLEDTQATVLTQNTRAEEFLQVIEQLKDKLIQKTQEEKKVSKVIQNQLKVINLYKADKQKITGTNDKLARENEELGKQVQILSAQLGYAHERNQVLCKELTSIAPSKIKTRAGKLAHEVEALQQWKGKALITIHALQAEVKNIQQKYKAHLEYAAQLQSAGSGGEAVSYTADVAPSDGGASSVNTSRVEESESESPAKPRAHAPQPSQSTPQLNFDIEVDEEEEDDVASEADEEILDFDRNAEVQFKFDANGGIVLEDDGDAVKKAKRASKNKSKTGKRTIEVKIPAFSNPLLRDSLSEARELNNSQKDLLSGNAKFSSTRVNHALDSIYASRDDKENSVLSIIANSVDFSGNAGAGKGKKSLTSSQSSGILKRAVPSPSVDKKKKISFAAPSRTGTAASAPKLKTAGGAGKKARA